MEDPTDSTLDGNLLKAVEFEASNRAHGSVTGDPFYMASGDSADAEPGTLLKVEHNTDTSLYTIPPGLALSRFVYQSKTSSGAHVPVSALILWPFQARPYPGGLPVVAWAHGTSGVTAQCAPSNIRNLWQHFQCPFQLALAGYVVVATDYAGLGVAKDARGNQIYHEYITGPAQANDLIYSIAAARRAFPELSKEFVLIGHSQGGGAVWAASQKMANEAVGGHLGTVAVAPVTSILKIPQDTPILGMVIMYLTLSLEAKYPDFKREDVLNERGLRCLDTYLKLQGTSTVASQLELGVEILKPGWQKNSVIQKWQALAANGGKAINGPMLVVQGMADPMIDTKITTNAIEETMKHFPGSQIEYAMLEGVSHVPAMYAGQYLWMEWIAERFEGSPAVLIKPGLRSYLVEPTRPGSGLQPQENWLIALRTEPWQHT